MARSVLVHLSLAGLVAGAVVTSFSTLRAQSSDHWLLSESGATGEADLKLDLAAAERALGKGVSPADAQRRMTRAMGELLRSHPGRNRLFDASIAPAGAVDVTAEFMDLVADRQVEKPRQAMLEPPQEPAAPQAQVQAQTGRPIIVTAPRSEPVVAPQDLASESVPLVTLTFPARITPRAEALLLETFRKLKWPAGCGAFMAPCSDNANYLDQIVAKTAYFVPDVYAALARELPANSVVIQPATLDVDRAGRFTYHLPNSELPSATTVDFIAFVAPRVYPTGPSSAYTHGLYVLPALVASSQPQSRNDSGKLFAISRGISPSDVGTNPSALVQLAATAEQKRSNPSTGVVTFGDKQLKITDAQWQHVESPVRIPEFVAALMAGELRPFVTAVKAIDRRSVERSQLARYAMLYSNEIAKAGPLAWALLPEFLGAEREFTNTDTLEALQALRAGEFGQSVRKMLLAEREQNKSAGRSRWAGALTAAAGGYFAGASGATSAPQIQQLMMSIVEQQAAMRRAGEAFTASVGGVSAAQRSVVVNFGQRQETVSARNIPELRERFRALLIESAPVRGEVAGDF